MAKREGVELEYERVDLGGNWVEHQIIAYIDGERVGCLPWDEHGRIGFVIVEASYRRQGIATAMWEYAHTLPIVPPEHSPNRTDAGDAWAASVGGYLPPRNDRDSFDLESIIDLVS